MTWLQAEDRERLFLKYSHPCTTVARTKKWKSRGINMDERSLLCSSLNKVTSGVPWMRCPCSNLISLHHKTHTPTTLAYTHQQMYSTIETNSPAHKQTPTHQKQPPNAQGWRRIITPNWKAIDQRADELTGLPGALCSSQILRPWRETTALKPTERKRPAGQTWHGQRTKESLSSWRLLTYVTLKPASLWDTDLQLAQWCQHRATGATKDRHGGTLKLFETTEHVNSQGRCIFENDFPTEVDVFVAPYYTFMEWAEGSFRQVSTFASWHLSSRVTFRVWQSGLLLQRELHGSQKDSAHLIYVLGFLFVSFYSPKAPIIQTQPK